MLKKINACEKLSSRFCRCWVNREENGLSPTFNNGQVMGRNYVLALLLMMDRQKIQAFFPLNDE